MKTWLKVTAHLPGSPDDWSLWTERFARFGIEGTVQTDAPPTLSAYLPPGDTTSFAELRDDLCSLGAKVETEDVEEIDWSVAWRQFFKPIEIGRTLGIRPSWEEDSVSEGRVEIVLDPGQAFGTGDHPTTRLCLELLEETELTGKLVADVGCGSGVLSIAAMKLGASRVDSVDTDPLSVEATKENAERNGVTVSAFLGSGFEPLVDRTYDIVVSNIISAAVISLAGEAAVHVKPGGLWIVSGIIEPNWPDVQSRTAQHGFSVETWRKEGDWVAAILRR